MLRIPDIFIHVWFDCTLLIANMFEITVTFSSTWKFPFDIGGQLDFEFPNNKNGSLSLVSHNVLLFIDDDIMIFGFGDNSETISTLKTPNQWHWTHVQKANNKHKDDVIQ